MPHHPAMGSLTATMIDTLDARRDRVALDIDLSGRRAPSST